MSAPLYVYAGGLLYRMHYNHSASYGKDGHSARQAEGHNPAASPEAPIFTAVRSLIPNTANW